MSVVSALADGCQRALGAPLLVLGVWVAYVLVPSPVAVERVDWFVALIDASALDAGPALAVILRNSPPTLAHALLMTFLLGGFMDRVARNRATASFGFFGACGIFAFRFLRLAVLAAPLYAALLLWLFPLVRGSDGGWFVLGLLLFLVHVLFDYARVRMVVEDRRSAIGALSASFRFVRRNAGAALMLAAVNATLAAATWWLAASFSIGLSAALYAYLLARALLRLIFAASLVALFQSRLAHAGYTARPQAVWPDSPAAEAISPR
jgi:hypothetical protein